MSATTSEKRTLIDLVGERDERPAERLTEDERMKRYLGYPFVLEAVIPRANLPAMLGRSPWPGPISDVRARAREMMSQGKDITVVRIRDTRTWKILENVER